MHMFLVAVVSVVAVVIVCVYMVLGIKFMDLMAKDIEFKHSESWVDMMTGNEYQELASRTINKALTMKGQQSHALHGMVGEIGEIHSLYQKEYQGHVLDGIHLQKELGDLLWFIAEYCTANEWKLEDIMKMNIEKLKARYPKGFSSEESLYRAEGDI